MTVRELMTVIGGSTVNIFWYDNCMTSFVGGVLDVPDYLMDCEVYRIIGDTRKTVDWKTGEETEEDLIHVIIK